MTNDTHLALIATHCRGACEGEPDFIERIKKSMREVRESFWMGGNDDLRFRGAIGGVLLAEETTEEEKERINRSLRALNTISAMQAGVPVDIEEFLRGNDDIEPLPLVKIWNDLAESEA